MAKSNAKSINCGRKKIAEVYKSAEAQTAPMSDSD